MAAPKRNQIMDTIFEAWKPFTKSLSSTAIDVFDGYTGPVPFVVRIRCETSAFLISTAEAGTYVTVPTQTWFEIRAGNVSNSLWAKLASSTATLQVYVEGNY